LNNRKCRRKSRRQQISAACDSLHKPLIGLIQMAVRAYWECNGKAKLISSRTYTHFLEVVTVFGAMSIVQIMGYTWYTRSRSWFHLEAILLKMTQCVPLATEPDISLIILIPMKILQRNLNRSTFVLWEMKRNVSVFRFKFRCNILISGKIIKEIRVR